MIETLGPLVSSTLVALLGLSFILFNVLQIARTRRRPIGYGDYGKVSDADHRRARRARVIRLALSAVTAAIATEALILFIIAHAR